MQLNPYLLFKGQCKEAFQFYEQNLGAKIEAMMTYGGSPMADHIPANWRDKIMHARLSVGGQLLMGSDPPPERYQQPQGFSVSLMVDKTDEAERIFNALAKGGQVIMPIQQTFWAARFGMVIDQFGIPWMVNCEKES